MTEFILLGLLAICSVMVAAGVFMVRRPNPEDLKANAQKRMARALAWRVGLSVGLFTLIWLAHWLGWIQPTGLLRG